MATIFQKIPSSGENCLILENGEALIYPFNIGDWTEMRMSIGFSFTSPSNDNAAITAQSISSSTSPKNSMFIGLFSGNNNSLPFSNNTSFIGFGNRTGHSVSLTTTSTPGGFQCYAGLITNSTQAPGSSTPVGSMHGFSSLNSLFNINNYSSLRDSATYFAVTNGVQNTFLNTTGSTNFAVIESMQFNINNKGQVGQNIDLRWNNNGATSPKTNMSIEQLSLYNQNTSSQSALTGLYYSSALSSTGTPLDIPNKLLVHFPFSQNRVRIHSILIEKYA